MILGLGTDIVENDRIKRAFDRHGVRLLRRIYTDDEVQYSLSHEDPVPYLSARFAVKEAAVKALGLRETVGLRFRDVEVSGKVFGKKQLVLHGRAREIADQRGARRFHISLTHTATVSMAVVILED